MRDPAWECELKVKAVGEQRLTLERKVLDLNNKGKNVDCRNVIHMEKKSKAEQAQMDMCSNLIFPHMHCNLSVRSTVGYSLYKCTNSLLYIRPSLNQFIIPSFVPNLILPMLGINLTSRTDVLHFMPRIRVFIRGCNVCSDMFLISLIA